MIVITIISLFIEVYQKVMMSIMFTIDQVSQSAFALLFSEMIQYSQNRVESISDLERRYLFVS